MRRPISVPVVITAAFALAVPASTSAHWRADPPLPRLTDAERPALRGDTTPPPTPRADCRPGSNPETDIQGRVPREEAADGFTCNMDVIGAEKKAGGFKVLRFVDSSGRECAYYDRTLLFPSNVEHLSNQPTSVVVLDMSDPSRPVRTTTLTTPAMQTPHESLVLNERRGLLVAVMGTSTFYPGFVDVYDLNADCRYPELRASVPAGLLGHESGFAPDGKTFYATSLLSGQVTAVDLTDPTTPKPIWVGQYRSHGLTVSQDGNRAYLADYDTGLTILDVSEIQSRRTAPQERVVSSLTWDTLTIPQVAVPVEIDGRRYVIEIDEFAGPERDSGPLPDGEQVGAARIIDIEDERQPKVVSDLRLEVHQPENRDRLATDPGGRGGYAGHYCAVPSYRDPGIVACSFIGSGLRVFDIRNPHQPRELAYFVAPGRGGNFAMSAPAFAPERGEIWYTDGNHGFYALRVFDGVWPFRDAAGRPARRCLGARSRVGSRSLGRVRLGHTRGRALSRAGVAPARRGRYRLDWCVEGRAGRVIAVFSSAAARGRARLLLSTAPQHAAVGVRPGARVGRVARRLPRARRIAQGIYRASPRSRRIFGVRGGQVRFVGVADRRLLRVPRTLLRYLRRAGS